ncbi:hypothetical protein [Stygiolobus caldivivus]|uniref:ABC transporter domain-containing protein n=1 Tax=Stygiolobus caldivivus TaxID=2824673 RepID=A0A8D5UA07_9CREN|nr:hypothetical protein [Stygiolobus caldivivus]BCU71451.1 hypothetical protein KN1_27480 [Stygiolobus caldivivus]
MPSLPKCITLRLSSVYGDFVKDVNLEVSRGEFVLVVGEWTRGLEELSKMLTGELKPRKGKIYRNFDKREIRLITREIITSELRIKDILRLYEKKFGKSEGIWVKLLLGTKISEDLKISELDEINRFKLELLTIFYGNVKLVVAEDFLGTIDTQFREYALKLLLKTIKIKSASLILFNSSIIHEHIFNKIVVFFGNEIVEETSEGEFYHPYSLLLQNAKLTIGKFREKVNFSEIGDPSPHGCPYHPYCNFIKKEIKKMCYTVNPNLFNVKGNKVRCWIYENFK